MPLEIQSPAPDIHVAALVGVLDSAAGQEMVASTKQTVRGRNESIALDCTRLRQMDMGGFRGLLSLLRWAEANEARVIIAGMSPDIWQMIVDNHCGDRFESRPSVPAALQSLGLGAAPAPQAPPAGPYQDYPEVDPYGAPPAAPAYGAAPARDPWAEMNAAPPVRGAAAAPGPWDQPAGGAPAAGGYAQPAHDPWAQPAAAPANDPWAQPAAAPAADPWAQPAAAPAHDPWAQPAGPAPAAGGDWNAQPAWGGGTPGTDDAWADYERQAAPPAQRPKATAVPAWRKPITLIIAGSVVLMLVLAWFIIGWLKVPEIVNAPPTITDTVGTSIPSYDFVVKNGVLKGNLDEFSKAELPEGVTLAEGGDSGDSTERKYTLSGTFTGMPGKKEVTLIAVRGSKESLPHKITFQVDPKTLKWSSEETKTTGVGQQNLQPFEIVANAESATGRWTPDGSGLNLGKSKTSAEKWEVTGTPLNAGRFLLEVTAKPKGGESRSKTFTFNISAPSPRPETKTLVWLPQRSIEHESGKPLPTELALAENVRTASVQWVPSDPGGVSINVDPTSQKAILSGTPTLQGQFEINVTATATGGGAADTQTFKFLVKSEERSAMKEMLLQRIETANGHFTDDEKTQLRQIVNMLFYPQTIATVRFANGEYKIDEERRQMIMSAFKEPVHADVLNDPNCQLFVVGYASTTGTPATNVRLSKLRARTVDQVVRQIRGKGGDLCGDYGPTDQLGGRTEADNRVVEIYAGVLRVPLHLEKTAKKFREDFNKNHGIRD